MPRSERRYKSVVYKQAIFREAGMNLQHLLSEALAQRPAARMRKQPVDDRVSRVINARRTEQGMLFGTMVVYEAGKDQTVLVIDDSQDDYPVDSFPVPQTPSGANREVLDSILYFAIYNNHVVLAQSRSLKSREVETHFAWLLSSCTEVLEDGAYFVLSDQPTEAARRRASSASVKSVKVGTPLSGATGGDAAARPSTGQRTYRRSGLGAQVLASLVGPDWRSDMRLEDVLDDANLVVNIEVTYKRSTTAEAQQILDDVATSLRHLEEEDVEIDLVGGGQIKGNELKLTGSIRVDMTNGVPSSSDMFTQMRAWLRGKIEDGSTDE